VVKTEEEAVRRSVKVSKDTDVTLRTFLGAQGMKKGDLSKLIEEAARRRVPQCTIQDIRTRNADADPDEIQRIVDEAVSEVRAEHRAKGKANKA
jgi:Ribbon-helix-helix domain